MKSLPFVAYLIDFDVNSLRHTADCNERNVYTHAAPLNPHKNENACSTEGKVEQTSLATLLTKQALP